jgi:hypothetical protein
MAAPTWTLPSNTLLGTLTERSQVSINLGVGNPEDRSTTETNQFVGLEHYSDDFFFYIRSNGLARTAWLNELLFPKGTVLCFQDGKKYIPR